MGRSLSSGFTGALLIVCVVLFVAALAPGEPERPATTHSQFLEQLDAGGVREVTLRTRDNSLRVTPARGPAYETGYAPALGNDLVDRARAAGVRVDIEPAPQRWWTVALPFLVLVLVIGAIAFFLVRRSRRNPMGGFGRAPARQPEPDTPSITFSAVAGADEAVEELGEIVAFLRDGARFRALGAKIPKGVLLYGPPGTGKTLLARAVAGEAGVPFFTISGSDFVEMFVGVGAARVRDLFERAKESAPCIVFVDEIDAVGRHRGAGVGGGHDEREQTLNQLLVELDGFEGKDNIILIAATNRPDILDPALLRPGRFDRQILVDRPDRRGRARILEVHARGKPLAPAVDLDTLAAATPGFTGADLANVVNEAALLAARAGRPEIAQPDFDEAILRVVAGPEKRTRVLGERERLVTAYHELGHAFVGHFLEHADPVHKVSIVGRGQALGYTLSLPAEDRALTTRAELLDAMAVALGGRAAEQVVFGDVTTGAADDLEKVTETAKRMVLRFGMSARLGPRVFGGAGEQPFLGRRLAAPASCSRAMASEIDAEIRALTGAALQRATAIVLEHRERLDALAEALVRHETLDRGQFLALLADVREPVYG